MKITMEHEGITASMEGDVMVFDEAMRTLVEPVLAAIFCEKLVEEYFGGLE